MSVLQSPPHRSIRSLWSCKHILMYCNINSVLQLQHNLLHVPVQAIKFLNAALCLTEMNFT